MNLHVAMIKHVFAHKLSCMYVHACTGSSEKAVHGTQKQALSHRKRHKPTNPNHMTVFLNEHIDWLQLRPHIRPDVRASEPMMTLM